ncbi:MAG: site-specific integrase [Anaerolineaceae bacterium]|nr:site-specific integrase [Anaerolineaceae bacterium]MBN2678499.1 site-specific integrase [Anaerolineaceae bacterium]
MTPDNIPLSAHLTAASLLIPAVKLWEIHLADKGRSPHTVKAFSADIQLLSSYLSPDRSIGSITTDDLNNFLSWLQTHRGVPCSPKSLSRRITALKSFFRWLQKGGVLVTDPAEKVIQQSVMSPLPEILTAEERQHILDVANRHRNDTKPDARPYTLVSLLLATGIKKGECLALSPNHLDLENDTGPLVFIRYSSPASRYKERKIALPAEWVAAWHEYATQYPLDDRIFPWSQRRLEYLLEDLGEEAGLGKHLSFDMCRWTSAVSDYQAGMEPEKIRQKLGVSKIQYREIGLKLRKLAGVEPVVT